MTNIEHYQVFGLIPGASEKELRKAYWEIAKKYHTDFNSANNNDNMNRLSNEEKERILRQINESYTFCLQDIRNTIESSNPEEVNTNSVYYEITSKDPELKSWIDNEIKSSYNFLLKSAPSKENIKYKDIRDVITVFIKIGSLRYKINESKLNALNEEMIALVYSKIQEEAKSIKK